MGSGPLAKIRPKAFYKRHPQLRPRKLRLIEWARHNIYEKVAHWFTVIGTELHDPAILAENVYNMDETGILLSFLASRKYVIHKDDLRKCRGAAVKRTLVTAVECISADGRSLSPLIIWPALTHRSDWTTYLYPTGKITPVRGVHRKTSPAKIHPWSHPENVHRPHCLLRPRAKPLQLDSH
jgi:hypothetical protein